LAGALVAETVRREEGPRISAPQRSQPDGRILEEKISGKERQLALFRLPLAA
jgi:hypothetical protein